MILLRIPGILAYRNLALRVVATACKMAFGLEPGPDAEDETEAQTVSAFGEAFNNVAIHGYAGSPGEVAIEISWTADELVIQLTDTGESFDPSTVEAPDLDSLPEGKMGLFIMRSFMDQIEYRQGPPNVLRMTKRRPRASGEVISPPPPVAVVVADPISRQAAGDSDWRFRAVNADRSGSEPEDERATGGARRS